MKNFSSDIENALVVLQKGGTLLYPTDTIWGLGCDAVNEDAVKKIFEIKKRNESKSMIVLLDDKKKLEQYVKNVPQRTFKLMEEIKKPLTIIYDGAKNLAANVIGTDGTVAIRITKNDFCKTLIEKFGKPIVSTSANISGKNAPQRFKDISPEIIQSVDYIVQFKQDEENENLPSTIIHLKENNDMVIIRE